MRFTLVATSLAVLTLTLSATAAELDPLGIFNQRILPIFRSPNPSSCVQCHLSAVDLKDYILPSSDATFASLRGQGLIDIDAPEESRILKLINMGGKDYDKGAGMIHARNRTAEYEAFAAWIRAGASDPRLRQLPAPAQAVGPRKPDTIIRHARADRVLDSFTRNIWSQRMRCFPCHTPYEIDDTNPKHRIARERMKKMEHQLGDLFTARMRIFRRTPEQTLNHLIRDSRRSRKDRLPLINLRDPTKSLLVLKPTARLPQKTAPNKFKAPSHVKPVSHLGGIKMHPDDFSYKAFVAWISDYARVVGNEYGAEGELPADNWHFTSQMMLLRDAPKDWPEAARVQFFVHARAETENDWSTEPIAFTQGPLTPRRTVFGTLILLRNSATEKTIDWNDDDPSLAPGRYLIKAYVDRGGLLDKDPAAMLGTNSFAGEGLIQAKWGKTFKNSEKLSGSIFQ